MCSVGSLASSFSNGWHGIFHVRNDLGAWCAGREGELRTDESAADNTVHYTTPAVVFLVCTRDTYTTLHYSTLHYTTPHHTTYTTLAVVLLVCTRDNYTTLHYTTCAIVSLVGTINTTLHSITLHYTTLHYPCCRMSGLHTSWLGRTGSMIINFSLLHLSGLRLSQSGHQAIIATFYLWQGCSNTHPPLAAQSGDNVVNEHSSCWSVALRPQKP